MYYCLKSIIAIRIANLTRDRAPYYKRFCGSRINHVHPVTRWSKYRVISCNRIQCHLITDIPMLHHNAEKRRQKNKGRVHIHLHLVFFVLSRLLICLGSFRRSLLLRPSCSARATRSLRLREWHDSRACSSLTFVAFRQPWPHDSEPSHVTPPYARSQREYRRLWPMIDETQPAAREFGRRGYKHYVLHA